MIISIHRGTQTWTDKYLNPYYGDLQSDEDLWLRSWEIFKLSGHTCATVGFRLHREFRLRVSWLQATSAFISAATVARGCRIVHVGWA